MLDVIQGGDDGTGPCEGCGGPIPRIRKVLKSGRIVWPLLYQPCPDCSDDEIAWTGDRRLAVLERAGLRGEKNTRWSFDRLTTQDSEDTGTFMHRCLTAHGPPLGVLRVNIKVVTHLTRWTRAPIVSAYLYGDVGTGKSVLACALVDELLRPVELEDRRRDDDEMRQLFGAKWERFPESRRWVTPMPKPRSVLYTTWRDCMWRITTKYKTLDRDAIKVISRAGILVIDDLGTWEGVDSKRRERAADAFEAVLAYRYVHTLPVVITSNIAFEDLRDRYGLRVADRLAEMCGQHVYRLRGPSWRQPPTPNPDGRTRE